MTFFVFLESDILDPPKRERLGAGTIDEALEEAAALMALRPQASKAHVFQGEVRVGVVHRP